MKIHQAFFMIKLAVHQQLHNKSILILKTITNSKCNHIRLMIFFYIS